MSKNNDPTSFETERLLLKLTTKEDAAFLLELLNSPKWLKNIGDRNVRSVRDAEVYIAERITPQFQRLGFANYTVIRKSDQVKIGVCGLYDRKGLDGVDIGFAFLPEYEAKGYAYESALKIRDAAFEIWDITILQGITIEENLPSRRLLEKLGFSLVGTTEIPGDDAELLLYRFSRET
ncbi:MAG: GNAT family N-acetyltransferase [Bacteroidia bacterium]